MEQPPSFSQINALAFLQAKAQWNFGIVTQLNQTGPFPFHISNYTASAIFNKKCG